MRLLYVLVCLLAMLVLITLKYARVEPQTDQKQFLSIDDPRLETHYVYIKTFVREIVKNESQNNEKTISYILSTAKPSNGYFRKFSFKRKDKTDLSKHYVQFYLEKDGETFHLKTNTNEYIHINNQSPFNSTTGTETDPLSFIKPIKPTQGFTLTKNAESPLGQGYLFFNKTVYFEISEPIPEKFLP